MDTSKLRRFAQFARRSLMEQIEARLNLILQAESAARREAPETVKQLEEQINLSSREQVIDRVAYTWFNRFSALRFMDVNRYTRIGIVSPAEGQFQPEILAEAKMGHINDEMVPDKICQQVFALLEGKTPSNDPQGEAYRLLVVAACNAFHRNMPFLFQRIDDYTELLMPDDLLSGNSILAYTREAMTPDACQDVEVIGWLYQFYISEKKDSVFEGLKKGKKIAPDNIPAATQLFTPHWIVRYLVENSLGRLWMLNRPSSRLVDKMDYYIKPEQPETDFLKIGKPEEIKICDPACGSGHMLTYAFDLLYAIYEEEGVDAAAIPEKILAHNLYGIEIDERAGELAAFALTMKTRAKQRRFFSKAIKPNICVLENVHFNERELNDYMDFIGRDLFTAPLQLTLRQFEEADNFGSLICPDLTDVQGILQFLEAKDVSGQLFLQATHNKALHALRQADFLSPKYHVVIANPPYMGGKGMNARLSAWAKDNYPNSKSDLFAMFIERNLGLAKEQGSVAMITMQSWMFLSSFESLRARLLNQDTILSMAHLGARAFDSIGGEVVSTTAFILKNANQLDYKGSYIRLVAGNSEAEKNVAIREAVKNPDSDWFYRASSRDFNKIPGHPFAYWLSDTVRTLFITHKPISDYADFKQGLATCNNDLFLRQWHEISISKSNIYADSKDIENTYRYKWFPFIKGGECKKWYGNYDYFVNWHEHGRDIHEYNKLPFDYNGAPLRAKKYYFREGLNWSSIASSYFAVRYSMPATIFGTGGSSGFSTKNKILNLISLLNAKTAGYLMNALSMTLNVEVGHVSRLPYVESSADAIETARQSISLAKCDWDSYENSWDFTSLQILSSDYLHPKLNDTYEKLRLNWRDMTLEMQQLEEENNRIFIDAYGLQDELTPEVPLNEITLTCNPRYRYGDDKSEDELEALLLADTMRELVSYAVGCMFGRYSLEKPGLILANLGETLADFLRQIPEPSFPVDDDNVLPMLDGDWFIDDISEQFRAFLRVAFGEDHYEENLRFIEKALGKNGKSQSIRDYFLKDFYSDHVRRYKKRPIYWLFSSPKGSFNALIYMHRYRPDTVSVVLNNYLRAFRAKLASHKNHLEAVSISASAVQAEKTKALKEIEKITKMINELEEYEREVLYPLATEKLEIDLDDGVKVNYPKFGAALKKIPGLEASDE